MYTDTERYTKSINTNRALHKEKGFSVLCLSLSNRLQTLAKQWTLTSSLDIASASVETQRKGAI